MFERWIGTLVFVVTAFVAADASAHPTPGSVAFVDFTVDGARIEQSVPIEELQRALHVTLAEPEESAQQIVERHAPMLAAYAAAHLRASSVASGRLWHIPTPIVSADAASDGPRAVFHFELKAPANEASASLALHDDIVAHEVVSHYTTVFVRSDWSIGQLESDPRLAGTIHAGRFDVELKRSGSFARGFRSVVMLGMRHIASGVDHLMFLFALLLVAPLRAAGGRWSVRRSNGEALSALARVVTAFTVGHSLTLVLGGLGELRLPSALVETGIAVSILVTALHAWRPWFPRHEALVAGAFGLVHGLGFAGSLSQHDLGRAQTTLTLLGFNIGIELAQLALLALVLPWLLIFAGTHVYRAFRLIGAAFAALLASAWLLERTFGFSNPTEPLVDWMQGHAMVLLFALAALSIAARGRSRTRALPETSRSVVLSKPDSVA